MRQERIRELSCILLCVNEPQRRHSFGIIPLQKSDAGTRVLLIQQSRLGATYWGFPKGTPEAGELPIDTACRETREEVGCGEIDLIPDFAHTESYVFTEADGTEVHKQVTYFAGYLQDEGVVPQQGEVLAAEWLSYDEALERLSYQASRDALRILGSRLGAV